MPRLAALAAVSLLALAGCAGGLEAPPGPAPAAPPPDSPAGGLLRATPFEGRIAGAAAPSLCVVGLAQDPPPAIAIPPDATRARIELAYAAAPPGLHELRMRVVAGGGQEALAEAQGASPLAVELEKADWQDATSLAVQAVLCEAPADQAYGGFASFFAGPVPGNSTALP